MKHFPSRPKVTQEEAIEHLANARQLINEAISEINQSMRALELSKELNQLYKIEDILWQYATSDRRREVSKRSCDRYSAITADGQRGW